MAAVWLWVRSARLRRGPMLLVAAIIAVAAGAGMAALAGARRADSALDRFAAVTGEANLQLVPVGFDTRLQPIDPALAASSVGLIDEAAAIPGVDTVTHTVFWALTPEPAAACPFSFGIARCTSAHPLGVTIAGRPWGARDAVAVNETASDMFGVSVGTELVLRAVGAEHSAAWLGGDGCVPLDGPEVPVQVTSIVRGFEDVTDAAEPFLGLGPGFYDRYADELANCACTVLVRADPDRVDEVRAQLEDLYRPFGFAAQPVEAAGERAAEAIGLEVAALRIAAIVVSLAGVLVVLQVLSRQATDLAAANRTRVALGMTRRQIAVGTTTAMLPAVFAGAALAVAGAGLASPWLPRGLARRAEPTPGYRIDAAVLAGGFIVTVLMAGAAAWVVGWMAARPTRTLAPRPVRGTIGPLPLPVALGMGMAANPAGDRGRVAAWSGVVGVAIAVTGVVAVSTVGASADHLLATPSLFGVNADLALSTEVDDPDAAAAVAREALLGDAEVEAVTSVYGLSVDSSEAVGPSGAAVSVEPEAMRHERGVVGPTIHSGRLPTSVDEVVLGRATADDLGTEIGDRVVVTRVDGDSVDYVVVGLAVSYGVDVVDQGFHVTEPGLDRLAVPCDADASAAPEDAASCVDVEVQSVVGRVAPGASRAAVAARLRSADVVPLPAPSIVDRFREIGPVPWYLAAMLALLGAGGLLHSSLLAGRRRARELAVARVLGFTPGQAAAAIRWQGVATAIAGLVIGLLAGALIGRIMWRHLAMTIGVVVDVRLPALAPVVATVWAALVVLVATAVPSARARRARPATVLRSE